MNLVKEELKDPPKNVASHLWEKFKALEKRTNEVTQRSTEKRIKHLQKQVLETVTKEFTSEEDKDILRHHDVKFGPPVDTPQESTRKRKKKNAEKAGKSATKEEPTELVAAPFEELKSYMGINDHLVKTDHSRPPPSTALEKKIDAAIKEGDFERADALSDHLSEREAGERIVAAIESKRFLEAKEVETESVKVKKKRKLNWGFEPKQRWETKGNM